MADSFAGRLATAALAAALLTPALAGCAEPGRIDPADVADCDAGDLRKQEVPDCGFQYRKKFYAWSWVTDGRQVPPPGWDANQERAQTMRRLRASRKL